MNSTKPRKTMRVGDRSMGNYLKAEGASSGEAFHAANWQRSKVTDIAHNSQVLRSRLRTALLTVVLFAHLSGTSGSEIVMVGDSWGVLTGPAMRAVLDADGMTSIRIHNSSVGGSSAAAWNSGIYGSIPGILAANPDVLLVHVIVGGIDLLSDTWNAAAAVEPTVGNVIGILRSVATATPAPILYTGYEYLANPPAPLTASEANLVVDDLVNRVKAAVEDDPVLSSRVTVINSHGFMQVQYGIPQLGISPGDLSLPDSSLPGPVSAFSDQIHLTQAAQRLLAEKLYNDYHSLALKPCCLMQEGAGRFQIPSVRGMSFEVEQSQDCAGWLSVGALTNMTGTLWFQDAQPVLSAGYRFYRVVSKR